MLPIVQEMRAVRRGPIADGLERSLKPAGQRNLRDRRLRGGARGSRGADQNERAD